jgi:ribose/xylose/arabinose/galactoside ABC-type transport system permease subunit
MPPQSDHRLRLPRLKEAGLLGVVLVLALLLSTFGGSLTVRDRQTGETRTVNKFLRADNLDKLAKNTSFFAIMAVGVTFVIVSNGIDLSIGSTYCLTAVCGAMFLHHFGPQGPGAGASPAWVIPAAILLCLGVGTLGGLLNGLGVVLLGVHAFVITLGTMAIYRGIAFVMTKAQAFTHFPPEFTDGLISYEMGHSLYPVPMLIMIGVTLLGALIIKMIDNAIIILEIDQNYSRIIMGAVIVVAVVLDRLNTALSERRRARAAGRLEGSPQRHGDTQMEGSAFGVQQRPPNPDPLGLNSSP